MSEEPVTQSLKSFPCIAPAQLAPGSVVPVDSEVVARGGQVQPCYIVWLNSAASPPGGRKTPVLCRYAFHLVLNNEERREGREKVDRLVLVYVWISLLGSTADFIDNDISK